MLDPEEQGALPVDRTCYRGVILVQGRVVQVLNKEFVNYVDLKGNQRCSKWNASAREPRQTELGICVFKATNTGMSEIERDTEICSWLLIIYYFFLHPQFFFFGLMYTVLQIALLLQTMYNHLTDVLDILKSVLGTTSGQACIVRVRVSVCLCVRVCMRTHAPLRFYIYAIF